LKYGRGDKFIVSDFMQMLNELKGIDLLLHKVFHDLMGGTVPENEKREAIKNLS